MMRPEKRTGVIGTENEVKIYRADGDLIDFDNLLKRIDISFLRQSDFSIWWAGGYLYEDGNRHLKGTCREKSRLVELSTHPVEIQRGCIKELTDIISFNLASLANLSDSLNISGYRRQYCISVDSIVEDVDLGRARAYLPLHPNVRPSYKGARGYKFDKFQVDVSKVVLNTIGPALVLLFGNRGERRLTLSPYFPGLSQRNKLEFDTDFLVEPNQLKAAIAFWVGCEKGIERLIKESVLDYCKDNLLKDYQKMPLTEVYKGMPFIISNVRLIPGPLKASLRVDGYEQDVQAFGSKALLYVQSKSGQYTLTCRDILREYFNFFMKDIAELSTPQEMRLLREYIKGKHRARHAGRNFSLDVNSTRIDKGIFRDLYGKTPKAVIDSYSPMGMSRLFYDAYKYPDKVVTKIQGGKVVRETIVAQTKKVLPDWDGVDFRLTYSYDSKRIVARIYVPRERYADYLKLEKRATRPGYFFEKAREMFK